jgi:hypothetical protein
MTNFGTNGAKLRRPADWVRARIQKRRLRDAELEGQDPEAMLHWRDPVDRLRTVRRRQQIHTLVDDNPASG